MEKKYREVINTGLSNYYGEVILIKEGDRYYAELGCHSSTKEIEISEGIFNETKKIIPSIKEERIRTEYGYMGGGFYNRKQIY